MKESEWAGHQRHFSDQNETKTLMKCLYIYIYIYNNYACAFRYCDMKRKLYNKIKQISHANNIIYLIYKNDIY